MKDKEGKIQRENEKEKMKDKEGKIEEENER